jgi:L-rhamnose mutarotase
MARIAFHITLREGKSEDYRELHRNVPEELEAAYLESDAGLETYSIYEGDGHVFAYLECEDPEEMRRVMEDFELEGEWDADVDGPVADEDGMVWMEEVYRMT